MTAILKTAPKSQCVNLFLMHQFHWNQFSSYCNSVFTQCTVFSLGGMEWGMKAFSWRESQLAKKPGPGCASPPSKREGKTLPRLGTSQAVLAIYFGARSAGILSVIHWRSGSSCHEKQLWVLALFFLLFYCCRARWNAHKFSPMISRFNVTFAWPSVYANLKLLLHCDHSACQYKSAQFNREGSAELT